MGGGGGEGEGETGIRENKTIITVWTGVSVWDFQLKWPTARDFSWQG